MENKDNRRSDNRRELPYELIKWITNDFSEELGRGAFAQVFKGVLEDGEEVAVKMLCFMGNINDQQIQTEFEILKRLEHPNIVRLVAFCDDAEEELVKYNDKLIVCQRIHRALCLEYMPNGSLGKLLTGENLDKNWPIRYRIIKGTCEGLKYLQEGMEFPIFHLDLKPDNILLNQEMVPKISDFGLSRLIGNGEENSKRTSTPLGTLGYLPPEFNNHQVISKEYDIYSLGVIITKIITGTKGYSDVADMGADEFIEHVHENWKKCLQEIPRYESLEVDCKQVKRCIKIARRCMENDRHKRPMIKDIVSQLDEIEMEKDLPWMIDPEDCKDTEQTSSCSLELPYPCCFSEPWHAHYSPEWSDGEASCMRSASCSPEWSDGEAPYRGSARSSPQRSDVKAHFTSATEPLNMEELLLGSSHNDPPWEISHPAHTEQKLKLMTAPGVVFMCDGCKEPGYGPRYKCSSGSGGHPIDLHTRCALAGYPLFGLHTLVHPLFGYGDMAFRFVHEPPSSVDIRICDACGESTRGYVYHCSGQDVDIHPCCASLPDRFLYNGRAFDLHRWALRPCPLCSENEGQRRRFWAYRCNGDGYEAAVDLHVACLKETARRIWDACYSNLPDVGVDGMLVEDMFSSSIGFDDKFGEIAGTVASFITALVFGKLIVKM